MVKKLAIFIVAIGCFCILSGCGNDSGNLDSKLSMTPNPGTVSSPPATSGEPGKSERLLYEKEEDFQYTRIKRGDSYEIEITGGNFAEKQAMDIRIPETIEGYPVTSIAAEAFRGWKTIYRVELPESLSVISSAAFQDCQSLGEINLEHVKCIGENAFRMCRSLKKVALTSLEQFGSGDFALSGVKEVIEPEQLKSSVGADWKGVFQGTPYIKQLMESGKTNDMLVINGILVMAVNCEGDVIVPDGVTEIAANVFTGEDGLISVTLPDSVIKLNECFVGCGNLKSVWMEDSVQEISPYLFEGSLNLEYLHLSNSIRNLPPLFMKGSSIQCLTLPESIETVDMEGLGDAECLEVLVVLSAFLTSSSLPSVLRKGRLLFTTELPEEGKWTKILEERQASIQLLLLNQTQIELSEGEAYELYLENGGYSNHPAAAWHSTDEAVAKVSQTGEVEAVGTGTAIITAEMYGKEYQCTVEVK